MTWIHSLPLPVERKMIKFTLNHYFYLSITQFSVHAYHHKCTCTHICIQVCYTNRFDGDHKVVQVDDEADEGMVASLTEGELWDLTRPLVGDCKLTLLKYDDPESKTVRT